jgi:hypothetical protein
MSNKINGIVQDTLLCHHGETNYAFFVGGLVQPSETPMEGAIRLCRRPVYLRHAQSTVYI